MAVALHSRIDALNYLRNVYEPLVRRQGPMGKTLLGILPKPKTKAQGAQFVYHLQTNYGGGPTIGSALNMPPSSNEAYVQQAFEYSAIVDVSSLDYALMRDAVNGVGAAGNLVDDKMKNLASRIYREAAISLIGDGSAIRGRIEAAGTATTFTAKDLQFLRDGGRYDIIRIADGSTGDGVTGATLAINQNTRVCTLSVPMGDFGAVNSSVDASGISPTYAVFKHNSYPNGSTNKPLWGLLALLGRDNPPAGGFVGGFDRSSDVNEFARGNLLSNPGGAGVLRQVQMSDFAKGNDLIRQYGNEDLGTVTHWLCHTDVYNDIMQRLLQSRRYSGETKKIMGWADALYFSELSAPIVGDVLFPRNTVIGLNINAIEFAQDDNPRFDAEKGESPFQRLQDKVGRFAVMIWRLQLMSANPKNHVIIPDVAGASDTVLS